MEIKNKIALVTGSSKGIGRSTAIALSKQGASVVINFNSDEGGANKVLQECNRYSNNNMTIKADITREEEVEEMFKKISEKYSKLDILINNAGIFDESDGPADLKVFEEIFSVNFLAQIRVTQPALSILKAGKVINVSSVVGRIGLARLGQQHTQL